MKEVISRLLVNTFHSWYVVYEGIENAYLQNSSEFQLHTKTYYTTLIRVYYNNICRRWNNKK